MNGKELLAKFLSLLTLGFIIFAVYYYFTEINQVKNAKPDTELKNNEDEPADNPGEPDEVMQEKLEVKTAALHALTTSSTKNDEGFFVNSGRTPEVGFSGENTHLCFTFSELGIDFSDHFIGYILVEFTNNQAGEILVFLSNENYSIRFKSMNDFLNDSSDLYEEPVDIESLNCPIGLINRI